MKTRFFFRLSAAAFVTLVAAASSSAGIQRQTTSPDTKARMIRLITILETDPYNKDAKAYRAEVLKWVIDAPDVSVEMCSAALGDLIELKDDDSASLLVEFAFAEARFILEHPEKAKDRRALYVAGIDGVLRTYDSMKTANSKLKLEPMEKLLKARADGKLDAHIDQTLKTCKA